MIPEKILNKMSKDGREQTIMIEGELRNIKLQLSELDQVVKWFNKNDICQGLFDSRNVYEEETEGK